MVDYISAMNCDDVIKTNATSGEKSFVHIWEMLGFTVNGVDRNIL